MKRQIPLSVFIKLIGFYSLIIGIIGTIIVLGITLTKYSSNPSPTPTMTVTPTISSAPTSEANGEEQFCGGNKDIQCPTGYVCVFEGGKYLSEGGKCVKQQLRQPAKEGEFCGGIAGFQCANGYRCKFTCPNGSICDDSQYPYPDAGGTCVKQTTH